MAKSATYSEVNAMKALDDALGQLEDEARRRVLNWAFSKFGGNTASPSGAAAGGSPPGLPQAGVGVPGNIKLFVAQKKPEGFYERVACLAYYLEKREDKSDLKTGDIRKANTDARLSNMSNPALFVKHATDSYGYLSRVGRGKFAISGRGEAIVEALPDRTKVKQALIDNAYGRKGKKGKKSKSTK
jgi:hypothetical protein